jgi:hypothetical protein
VLFAVCEHHFPEHFNHGYAFFVAAIVFDIAREPQDLCGLGFGSPRILKYGLQIGRR